MLPRVALPHAIKVYALSAAGRADTYRNFEKRQFPDPSALSGTAPRRARSTGSTRRTTKEQS
jgi:hypothetical protein